MNQYENKEESLEDFFNSLFSSLPEVTKENSTIIRLYDFRKYINKTKLYDHIK